MSGLLWEHHLTTTRIWTLLVESCGLRDVRWRFLSAQTNRGGSWSEANNLLTPYLTHALGSVNCSFLYRNLSPEKNDIFPLAVSCTKSNTRQNASCPLRTMDDIPQGQKPHVYRGHFYIFAKDAFVHKQRLTQFYAACLYQGFVLPR